MRHARDPLFHFRRNGQGFELTVGRSFALVIIAGLIALVSALSGQTKTLEAMLKIAKLL